MSDQGTEATLWQPGHHKADRMAAPCMTWGLSISLERRLELVSQIEALRKSNVICLALGDKPNLVAQLNQMHLRKFYPHLRIVGKTDRLDLFLYTRGGDTLVPLRLVQLLRSHCKKLSVLVPFRAHSAGTMICLGADSVVMSELGELTPIDPRTENEFNPIDPLNPRRRVPIGVEDVRAYFDLAKELGLKGTAIKDVFQKLAADIHPLALGNVERTTQLIRLLAKRILETHVRDRARIESIVKALTRERFAHSYFINSSEGRELGLAVETPDSPLEEAMWNLLIEYETEMDVMTPFDPLESIANAPPAQVQPTPAPGSLQPQAPMLPVQTALTGSPFGTRRETQVTYDVTYIESLKRTDRETLRATIALTPTPAGDQVNVRMADIWSAEER